MPTDFENILLLDELEAFTLDNDEFDTPFTDVDVDEYVERISERLMYKC